MLPNIQVFWIKETVLLLLLGMKASAADRQNLIYSLTQLAGVFFFALSSSRPLFKSHRDHIGPKRSQASQSHLYPNPPTQPHPTPPPQSTHFFEVHVFRGPTNATPLKTNQGVVCLSLLRNLKVDARIWAFDNN